MRSSDIDAATIADAAPALLALVEASGRVLWLNRLWTEITGESVDDLRDRAWIDLFLPDDRQRVLEALARREPFELDVRIRGRNQRSRWVAMRGAAGDSTAVVVSAIDITASREARQSLELLAQVGEELNASLAINEVLAGIARLMAGTVAEMCTIAIHDARGRLRRVGIAHRDNDIESLLRRELSEPIDPESPSAIAQVMRTGTVLYRPIVDAPGPDEPWPALSIDVEPDHQRSLICAPLQIRDEAVGTITLISWAHRYTPSDVELAQEVARRCAAAVDNAALYRRSEDARARLALVAGLGEELALTLDTEAMLEALVRRVVPLFADAAVVALLDAEGSVLHRRAVRHVDPKVEELFRSTLYHVPMEIDAREPPAQAVRTGRPVLIEDYHTRAEDRRRQRYGEVGEMLEVSSVLAVPLLSRGRALGVVTFAFTSSDRRYSATDVPIALDLARRGATALERAQEYVEERRIAETLQRSMLPDALPEVPGINLCARYLPGGKIGVGGDWYDVVPLPGGRYGIAIGDVAGHGVRAATVMGQLRHALRAFASDGHDPATVIGRLNRFVFEQGPLDMATLCYAVIDPLRGRVEITTAGHVPPLLVPAADGPPTLVEIRPGPPIGADIGSRHSSMTLDLEPGSMLVFYTDGLIERRGEPLDVGFKRLLDVVCFAPPMLDAACDRLIAELVGDHRPADDVALLGLRYVGASPGRLRRRRPARAAELAPMRRILAGWLENAGVPSDEIGLLGVAASEAATNAIEHAYGPIEGWFEVEAVIEPDGGVTIVVRDGGRWRPKARGGGGRGLTLISRLVHEFELVRRPTGTEVWMRRRPPGEDN